MDCVTLLNKWLKIFYYFQTSLKKKIGVQKNTLTTAHRGAAAPHDHRQTGPNFSLRHCKQKSCRSQKTSSVIFLPLFKFYVQSFHQHGLLPSWQERMENVKGILNCPTSPGKSVTVVLPLQVHYLYIRLNKPLHSSVLFLHFPDGMLPSQDSSFWSFHFKQEPYMVARVFISTQKEICW